MAGKFEVYRTSGGKFRLRPKAGNGQVVARGAASTASARHAEATAPRTSTGTRSGGAQAS